MNQGKKFERNWKESSDFYKICTIRLNDSDMSFHQFKELRSRFTAHNVADFIQYYKGKLFAMELKSTEYSSISIQREPEEESKMIKLTQINSLVNLSQYDGVIAGLVLNFRQKDSVEEDTYFLNIKDFSNFLVSTDKKSINKLDIVQNNGLIVKQKLKRTNYLYNVQDLLERLA